MAEPANGKSGKEARAEAQQPQLQASVVGQYIKDLSFENPNINRLLQDPGDNPSLKLEVNVNARKLGEEMYESAIDFRAVATNKHGTIYELELVYAGVFRLQNLPDAAAEPFLLINCPTLLFPFLRRIVSDISREGGFPPLLLDPIDFAQLYVRRKQEQAAAQATAKA
jgi:preprotein translocase subunit SecB